MNINCSHFSHCSGCVYDSIKSAPETFFRAKKFFKDAYGITLKLKKGKATSWRTRSKLAVRRDPQENDIPVIGLFEKGSHTVLSIPHCKVHHPAINTTVELLKSALIEHKLTGYCEKSHLGDLRYIQCIVERRSERVQLALVANSEQSDFSQKRRFDALAKMLYDPMVFHSIWLNYNTKKTNTIFGPFWEKLCGDSLVWERLNDKEVPIGPSAFSQANPEMYELLLDDLYHGLFSNMRLLELYAGSGTIGLQMAKKCKLLRLVEVQNEAKGLFTEALERMPYAMQKKITYSVCKAEECSRFLEGIDTCIVDPPRKGLKRAVIDDLIAASDLQALVYISCGFDSLENDLRYIQKHHKEWHVVDAIAYLFFPGTDHIEVMVFLRKNEPYTQTTRHFPLTTLQAPC